MNYAIPLGVWIFQAIAIEFCFHHVNGFLGIVGSIRPGLASCLRLADFLSDRSNAIHKMKGKNASPINWAGSLNPLRWTAVASQIASQTIAFMALPTVMSAVPELFA
jgi:hypothetical protein